jgi:hypothetical protein
MNINDFKFNPKDGRKRQKENNPIAERIEKVDIKQVISQPKEPQKVQMKPDPTDIHKNKSTEIITEHTHKFIPTKAPPVPIAPKIQTLTEVTAKKPLPLSDGDISFKNVENIARMEDGRVLVTRVYSSYEEAISIMEALKAKPAEKMEKKDTSCHLCGSGLLKQGYTLVCPYCFYEKNK